MTSRVDEHTAHAPAELCYQLASDVERWPLILPHYRRVAFHRSQQPGHGIVEMAAWRIFAGPIRYPVWWVSEMVVDPENLTIDYRHIRGVTRGMIVRWEITQEDVDTRMRVTHTWDGPAWPVVRRPAWEWLIGPFFVSAIAKRTLTGITIEAQRITHSSRIAPAYHE